MLSWGLPALGSRAHNHWAVGGCLEKLDRLTGTGSQEHQKDKRLRSTADALETALGMGERWDAFNAGHCNQEAMRAAFFREPTAAVQRDLPKDDWRSSRIYGLAHLAGLDRAARFLADTPAIGDALSASTVTFEPSDIRGLMVLCMDDLVDTKKGNGGFEYVGFRTLKPKPGVTPDPQDRRFDPDEPYPHEVIETVCKKWGARDRRGIILDTDPSPTLNNRLYDGGEVRQLRAPPTGFDAEVVPEGGEVKFYNVKFSREAEPGANIDLDAWVHTAHDGTVTSNWVHDGDHGKVGNATRHALSSAGLTGRQRPPNPDFFWIAHLDEAVKDGAPWIGFADKTNPEVDMFVVWTLYMESTNQDWRAVVARHPDRVRQHLELTQAREAPHADQLTELLQPLL